MKPAKSVICLLVGLVFVTTLAVARRNADPGEQMVAAATNVLAGLSDELRSQASFAFDDPERINWHFIPRDRKGAVLKAMTEDQKNLVRALLKTGTSPSGYDKAVSVMTLEAILRDIENTERARMIRDPELYYVSIFGTPAKKGRWGWRIEGHHLCMNYTVNDGQVISQTPLFFGANPGKVPSGPHEGLRILAAEEDLARKLYQSFEGDARAKATIADKAPGDILSGTQNIEPAELPTEGIAVSNMSEPQKEMVSQLLEIYVNKHPAEIAARLIQEVKEAGLEKVHFGWYGPSEPGQPHAYRIQGPTFIVEYNNTQNGANHIHSVWRNRSGEFGTMVAAN